MDKVLEDQLHSFIDGNVCLMGIGNRHWHDDGVGSYIAEALESCPGFDAVDTGFIPENYLETIFITTGRMALLRMLLRKPELEVHGIAWELLLAITIMMDIRMFI